jgi:mannose-1-phosphate guanylyltransferase / mannose-6-phosphate isomerase
LSGGVELSTIIPVVLSGGSGTRLWPLSRAMYPKQFLRFFDRDEASLLGATLKRLSDKTKFGAPILICNNDHRFLVREEATRVGVDPRAIILEPVARNTAPAVAVAALYAERLPDDAVLVVMPSDHLVKDEVRFADQVLQAAKIAEKGKLVLFGVTPDEPHTGYGYLRRGAPLEDRTGGFAVAGFYEKPTLEKAQEYLERGGYFWNSGLFVMRPRTYIQELEHHAPEILQAARNALANAADDLGFLRLHAPAFAVSPNISIDYSVMEKTDLAAMLPLDVGWSDIGSWASLWSETPHDEHGNATHGDMILMDTKDCLVRSERSLVATIGVDDLVIVDTPDALLVADKSRSQDVAKIVAGLKRSNRKEHEQHLRNHRPWGFFETLSLGPRFQVKLLHVRPGSALSLQMHHHRSEHWVVVQGTAKVTIDNTQKLVRENESVYIVATQWHRLENPGKVPLELIEIQTGAYFGEDDIVRSDDIYRRAPEETR